MRQAQDGDQAAIDDLFARLLPYVERVVRSPTLHLGPEDSARDLAQTACLRVLVKLHQFQGADAAPTDDDAWGLFSGWVRRIVHNVRRNDHRDRDPTVPLQPPADGSTSRPGSDPPSPDKSPSSFVRSDEKSRLVLQALGKLPEETREIVRLRFFEGLSLRDIEQRLPLTYDQIRERYKLGMSRLRKELKELE